MSRNSIGLFGAFALAALLSMPAEARDTLVVTSFGGAYEKIHRKLVIDPFAEKYDVDVKVVTAYSADALAQLRAQKAAPQFDVVHFSGGQEIVAAREGLLSPIAAADAPNIGKLYPFATAGLARGEGPVYAVAALGLLYNRDKAPRAPTRWHDLLDPAFKDHVVLTDLGNAYGLLGFLMINKAEGGDLTNLDPGFNAVKSILGTSTIVATSPELQSSFAQNDAWLAPYAQDYAFTLRKAGLPVDFVQGEEGTPASYITTNLVANRPHQDLARKFIDMELSAEVQKGWAEELRYTPTNKDVVLDGAVAKEVVYGDAAVSRLLRFDPVTVSANSAAWVERWKKLIAR